jgi:hypothetical protein
MEILKMESLKRKGVNRLKPKFRNMWAHSAICSCSVELYKQWYTLADFLPYWDISRGFLIM